MAQANYVTNAIRAFITDTSAKASTNPVREAHVEFVAALAGHPPRPVSIDADATDLEDRADYLNKVLNALPGIVRRRSSMTPRRTSPAGLISVRSMPSCPISRRSHR